MALAAARAEDEQRRGGQGAAGLLQDQAQAQVAEVRAAVFLGDDHPGPAHLAPSRRRRRGRSPAAAPESRILRKAVTGDFSWVQVRAASRSMLCSSVRTAMVSSFPN